MKSQKIFKKLVWALLILCSIALLATSIYRAATFPFTHDESLSYAGFTWQPMWRDTSNNHLLNTWLMSFCAKYFGTSELSLRLPNILAHMLYLFCSLLIIKRINNIPVRLVAFSLLNLNPFVLNFFFLARGYGLAMGFQLLSLYLIIRAYEMDKARGHALVIYFAAFAGGLSTLASFTFLYFYIPVLLVCLWLIIRGNSFVQLKSHFFGNVIFLLLSNGLLLGYILPKIFDLQKAGELYFGGTDGFIKDTMNSLIQGTLYHSNNTNLPVNVISISVIVLFVLMLIYETIEMLKKRKVTRLTIILVMTVIAAAIPIFQHLILKTPFLIERSALFYIPLFALSVTLTLNSIVSKIRGNSLVLIPKIFSILIVSMVCWLYIRTFSLSTCYDWEFDKYNKQVIQIIDQDRQIYFPKQTISVGITWLFEPSLNFYRVTKHYDWMAEVNRKGINLVEDYYIYAYEEDVMELKQEQYTFLKAFPEINTVLLRVNK